MFKIINSQDLSYLFYTVFWSSGLCLSFLHLSELKQDLGVLTSVFQDLNSFWVLFLLLSFSGVCPYHFWLKISLCQSFKEPSLSQV